MGILEIKLVNMKYKNFTASVKHPLNIASGLRVMATLSFGSHGEPLL